MVRRAFAAGMLMMLLAVPATSEAQYFGRNKVQYRAFDFQVMRTSNFDVYYYPEEREAALDAARMVERAYARLSRLLQHDFRDRKPLILYASHADFQQTNALPILIDESTGGVTEAYKNRMILPFTGSYAHFDHVLNHELVHAFQYDVIFRRGVMTDAVPMGARLPLWFMEGMAEYLSVGRVDPHTRSWLRDAVLGGYLRSIAEMNQRDDYLSYRFGQSLWAYIGGRWGDEVVGILLQKAPRVGLDRAFETTINMSLDQLSEAWTTAVRQEYLPQVAEYDRPQTFAHRLTSHEELFDPWFLAPALSPDGESLVYLSQRDGFFFDLWLADASTGEARDKLIGASGDANFESLRYMNSGAAFSPDGGLLAFAAQTGGRDALYIYDVPRRRVLHRLRFPLSGIAGPSWSPDGERIVFSGQDGGLSDLFITDLEGNLTRLTGDRHADLMPAWSPDGRTIAFTTDRGPETDFAALDYGNMRVALYDLETHHVRVLPGQGEGKNVNPVWSPDGEALIWVGDRTGTNNLYLFEMVSESLHRISDLLSGTIAVTPLSPVLSWSRSDRLAFVYFENAGYNIYRVDDPRALPRHESERPLVADAAESEPVVGLRPYGSARTNGASSAERNANGEGRSRPRPPFVGSFYRDGDGFRRSEILGEATAQSRPLSVVALLDSVALALPDTAGFEHSAYRTRFSTDVVGRPTFGAQIGGHYGGGVYGGSFIALSDMLGNHNVLAALALNGSLSDATVFSGYSFLGRRLNWIGTLSQTPLYRYLGTARVPVESDGQARDALADVFLRDVVRSAQVTAAYPFNAFRRLELGLAGVHYDTDALYFGVDRHSGEVIDEHRDLGSLGYVQPMAALVFDNSLFGWTGPIHGRRYRLQVSHTVGGLEFSEGLVDVRNYWNIDRRVVFATRLVGLTRFGPDSDRFPVYWGGPYFLRGYDGGSFDPDGQECDSGGSVSRCPARDQLIGASAAFANVELRVPVITELQIGFLGTFPPIDAVAFVDGGVAWDERVCRGADYTRVERCTGGEDVHVVWSRSADQDPFLYRQPLFSYGLGLRINIFYTVLRLDYARPLNRPDRGGRLSLALGPSF